MDAEVSDSIFRAPTRVSCLFVYWLAARDNRFGKETSKVKSPGETIRLAATDLSNHLLCEHVTSLDLGVAHGEHEAPPIEAPHLVVIQQRGLEHEKSYIRYLMNLGLSIADLREDYTDASAIEQTQKAMNAGVEIIVQAALGTAGWFGRPDILRRTDMPSDLGCWSYEPYDCKLARDTKAATILQLSHYAALLSNAQGRLPNRMFVVPPSEDFGVETYRVLDYAAYYRAVRARLESAIQKRPDTYPEPTDHCGVCRWWTECDHRWRRDDHLSLTAGISRLQRKQLIEWAVPTVESLARMPLPLTRVPLHGARDGYVRIREQARVQIAGRKQKAPVHELLPTEDGRGLCRLPEPSAGDLFFDLESDPFVGTQGLEYLFGFTTTEGVYERQWALSAEEEKAAFEWFVDFVMERWEEHPTMHIFHFSHKEPSTLKALMGRYATSESEIDRWLRGGLLVDLHSILKQSVRASVEQYSLKDLEAFHGFKRDLALDKARTAMRQVEHALELGRSDEVDDGVRSLIESYNSDDCRSTSSLRNWLERLRQVECERGVNIPRPAGQDDAAPENVSERQARVQAVVTALQQGVPADERERSPEQAARWLLSNLLDWHRREDKVAYWEKYRLRDLGDEELQDERAAVSGLTLVREIPPTGRKKLPLHEYSFRLKKQNCAKGIACTITMFRSERSRYRSSERRHGCPEDDQDHYVSPPAVYTYEIVDSEELAGSLLRIGEWVVANGFSEMDPYRAVCDLLLQRAPRLRKILPY